MIFYDIYTETKPKFINHLISLTSKGVIQINVFLDYRNNSKTIIANRTVSKIFVIKTQRHYQWLVKISKRQNKRDIMKDNYWRGRYIIRIQNILALLMVWCLLEEQSCCVWLYALVLEVSCFRLRVILKLCNYYFLIEVTLM